MMQLPDSSNASFASELDSRSSVGTHTPRSSTEPPPQRPRRRRQSDLREKDLLHATELKQQQQEQQHDNAAAVAGRASVPPIALHALSTQHHPGGMVRRTVHGPTAVVLSPQQQGGDDQERRNHGSGKVAPASSGGGSKQGLVKTTATTSSSLLKNFDYSPIHNTNKQQRLGGRSGADQGQPVHAVRRVFRDDARENGTDRGGEAHDSPPARDNRSGPSRDAVVHEWMSTAEREGDRRSGVEMGVASTLHGLLGRRTSRAVQRVQSRALRLLGMLMCIIVQVFRFILPTVVAVQLFGVDRRTGISTDPRGEHQKTVSAELLWGAIRFTWDCADGDGARNVMPHDGQTCPDDAVPGVEGLRPGTMDAAETRRHMRRLDVRIGALQNSLEDVVREMRSLDGVVGGLHHLVDQHDAALRELQ